MYVFGGADQFLLAMKKKKNMK